MDGDEEERSRREKGGGLGEWEEGEEEEKKVEEEEVEEKDIDDLGCTIKSLVEL